MAEEPVDKNVHKVFTRKDKSKFESEWAKVKALEMMQSATSSILDDKWLRRMTVEWIWTRT